MKDTSFRADPENSDRRRDTRALQGELPWPRLLTLKNRPAGELVYMNKGGKFHLSGNLHKKRELQFDKRESHKPWMIETARICMPNASIFEGVVFKDAVSPAAFESLLL